jgi:hypothetical protein
MIARISFFAVLLSFLLSQGFTQELYRKTTENYTFILHQNPVSYELFNSKGLHFSQATIQFDQTALDTYKKTISSEENRLEVLLTSASSTALVEFCFYPAQLTLSIHCLTHSGKLRKIFPFRGKIQARPTEIQLLENGYSFLL